MFRLPILLITVLLLAGCSTTASDPRIWYDRKYNEYRSLRGHVPPFRSELRTAAASEKQGISPQEQMERMEQEMETIRNTADLKERQRLIEQHMNAMHAHADIMRDCMLNISGPSNTPATSPR